MWTRVYLVPWHCCRGCQSGCQQYPTRRRSRRHCTCEYHLDLKQWTSVHSHQHSSHLKSIQEAISTNWIWPFYCTLYICARKWKGSWLTDSVELNALITQVLRVDNDVVLGFAVSDQHTNLSRVRSHSNVLLEIVLEQVVQSQACNADVTPSTR